MQVMEVEMGCREMEGEDWEMIELADGERWICESTQGNSQPSEVP